MESEKPCVGYNEGKLKKYVYRDNSAGGSVVFECVAQSILEADQRYEEVTGKNPEKQNYIGCSFLEVEPTPSN